MDNGTRPGLLNYATLKHYYDAEEERGNRVMLVHKRSKAGPAIFLGMDPDHQKLMAIYVERMRPQYAESDEVRLFLFI